IGDLQAYTVFQAANSLGKMAENQGTGGSAMGMGMGAGYGMMMPGMIRDAMQSGAKVNPNQFGASSPAPTPQSPASSSGMDFGSLKTSSPPPVADPKQLVRSVAQNSGWQCLESGDAWQIVVPIGSLRKQTVAVRFD